MLLETKLIRPLVAAEVYLCDRQPFSRRNSEHEGNTWFVLKCFTGMK